MLKSKMLVALLTAAMVCVCVPLSLAYDEGSGDDNPKADQMERDLGARRQKSPAIAITERVALQIPRPQLPEGKTMIREVRVTGSTILADAAIEKLKRDYENKELTAGQMRRAADRIRRAYIREGYITSYAYVNAQMLASGVLELIVKEGKTGTVTIQGNQHFSTALLRKKITLKEGQLFNFKQLNHDVFVLNKHQDRKMNITCDPNVETGLTNVTLSVKDKNPFHVVLQADNYGSEYITYKRYKTFLTHNNLTGNDDSLTVKYQVAESQAHTLVDFDYFLPLNNNWKWEVYLMPYKLEDYKGSDNPDTDFEKHAWKWYTILYQTLINEPECELVSSYGFVYKDIDWWKFGQKQKWDKFRALMWGMDLNRVDRYGRWVVSNDFEMGIPRLMGGNTHKDDSTSVQGAGGGYKKNKLTVARRQKLVAGIDFITKANWQLSSQALTGVNCFSVGGIMGVIDNRGYPRAQAPGDRGQSVSAGFSFPAFGMPKHWVTPFSSSKVYDNLKLFTFYDWGQAKLKSPPPGERTTTTLASLGWGFTFNVPDQNLAIRMDMGWPVSNAKPKDGDNVHTWWSVTKGF